MSKFARWITYAEAKTRLDNPHGIGGLGGCIVNGDRWKDYLDENFGGESFEAIESLREAIVRDRIRRGGFWHQGQSGEAELSVPLFDDGTVATFSMRAWGDLLAAVWAEHEGRDYHYALFAWYSEDEDRERAARTAQQ